MREYESKFLYKKLRECKLVNNEIILVLLKICKFLCLLENKSILVSGFYQFIKDLMTLTPDSPLFIIINNLIINYLDLEIMSRKTLTYKYNNKHSYLLLFIEYLGCYLFDNRLLYALVLKWLAKFLSNRQLVKYVRLVCKIIK